MVPVHGGKTLSLGRGGPFPPRPTGKARWAPPHPWGFLPRIKSGVGGHPNPLAGEDRLSRELPSICLSVPLQCPIAGFGFLHPSFLPYTPGAQCPRFPFARPAALRPHPAPRTSRQRCTRAAERVFWSGRGVAQPGSAPALGAGSRRFKSSRPDQVKPLHSSDFQRATFRGFGTLSGGIASKLQVFRFEDGDGRLEAGGMEVGVAERHGEILMPQEFSQDWPIVEMTTPAPIMLG